MSSWGMKTLQAMEETIQSKPTGCFNKGISRMYSNSLVHILGAIFAAIAFWSGRLCCTLPFVAKLRQHCTKRFCGDSILQLGHIPFSWLRPFSTSDIIVIDNPWDFPSSFTDNLIDTTTSSRQHHLLVDIQGVEGHCAGSVKKVTSATMELIRFFKLSLLSHRCHVRRSNCFFECVGVVREGNVKVSSWPRRGVLLLDFLLLSRSPPHQISVIELLESISKLYAVESVTPTNNNAAHTKPFMKWKYIPRKALSPSADTDGSFKINRPLESRWIQYRQGGFYKKQVSQIAADGGMGTVEKRLQNINRYTYYYEALVHPAMITHDNPQRILLLLSNLVLCDGFVEEILKYNAVVRLVVVADAPEMTECYYSDPALKVAMNNRCFKEDERVEVIYNTRISEWFANTSKDESFDVTFIDRACFVDNLSLLDKISESLGEDGILVTPIGTVSSNYVGPTTPPLYLLEEQRHLEIIAHLEEANFRSIHEYEESRCDRCFLIAMKNIESRARWYRNEGGVVDRVSASGFLTNESYKESLTKVYAHLEKQEEKRPPISIVLHSKEMPSIVFKKTFKMKPSGFQFATEKSFSFHGPSVTAAMIDVVNQRLATQVQYVSSANKIAFHLNNNLGGGHYYASMNHDCQKYHEEDIVAVILDAMEDMGWQFRFQYDTESSSSKLTGDSITSRELFLFHKVKIPTYVSAVLHKPNKEALTGLVFQPGLAGEGVAIQSIKPNSLASMAFPSLKPGMEIISINEYTPTTPEGVASTLKSLAGDITITAKLPN